MITKWDRRFLEMARLVSSWSKDPSTKVGSVVVRPDKTVASVGFNGFPRGVADTEARLCDRGEKLDLIVHAEINALSVAHESLSGYSVLRSASALRAMCNKHHTAWYLACRSASNQ